MISKILLFIATLCIVNASVNTINDANGLSIFADAVNDEPGNFDLNLNEDVKDSLMGGAGLKLDSVNLSNEGRIRICSSSICNRVCRVLKLRGKCVKKRCKCLPKGFFITADAVNDESENIGLNFNEDVEALSMPEEAGFMVNEEVENPNLITEE